MLRSLGTNSSFNSGGQIFVLVPAVLADPVMVTVRLRVGKLQHVNTFRMQKHLQKMSKKRDAASRYFVILFQGIRTKESFAVDLIEHSFTKQKERFFTMLTHERVEIIRHCFRRAASPLICCESGRLSPFCAERHQANRRGVARVRGVRGSLDGT